MPKPQYDNEHQKARKVAIATMTEGTPCPFCGRPMYRRQRLDLDHVVPVRFGGKNGATRLSHSSCNRRAGGRIGNRSPSRKGVPFKRIPRKLPGW